MTLEGNITKRKTKSTPSSEQSSSTAKTSKNKKNILIIEDDPDLGEMYKIKLETEGLNVLLIEDGKYGIKAINDNHPDLVLLDILMPQKDGFDLLEEKNKSSSEEIKKVPTVVLTNLASPLDMEEGKRLGAADWWIKAYNTPAEVADKVKKFLNTAT